ncbi:MAG TPA: radical SAM protein [Syntrophorhabdaceae bacterium]|nr:radical SAM protein [Syntrophorhabdaceae bacterium]
MATVKDYSFGTESLCPVCLRKIPAKRESRGDDVFLVKTCEDHGPFETIIWRGKPLMENWQRPKKPEHAALFYAEARKGCPFDCGLCEAHQQIPCSVLLEVTDRCNLKCTVCFADAGYTKRDDLQPGKIRWLLERAIAATGPSNLQISGGEPTLRDDLPEIVKLAQDVGYSFVQVNTNGIRLASDRDYVNRLKEAGLSSVFLQFDALSDAIYEKLRGKALFDVKLKAVDNCGASGIGVVLVPTLVKGINTGSIGDIVRLALGMSPTVRGIHFQPISYFGRFPGEANDKRRFTLPELMRTLEEQTNGLLKVSDFSPPGCEHAHCSFHASYMNSPDGKLRPLTTENNEVCCSVEFSSGGVKETVDTVSRRWTLPPRTPSADGCLPVLGNSCCNQPPLTRIEEDLDLDFLLRNAARGSFTISAMAFQDADNLDLERLRGCCISVISHDGTLVPFCAYNLTARNGQTLYRPGR